MNDKPLAETLNM